MLFSPGSTPFGPKVETKKALLIIDLQNDFTSPDGKLHVANTANFLPRLPQLIAKFREKGQVIWVQTTYQQPCSSLSPQSGGYSILLKNIAEHLHQLPVEDDSTAASLRPTGMRPRRRLLPAAQEDQEAFLSAKIPAAQRCCLPGSIGSEVSTDLFSSLEKQKDIIFDKSTYSAFADFSFAIRLRARMISDLYICGSLSNISVHATVLDAVQQGFNVYLIEDCLGFRHDVCHVEAMRRMADDLGANGIDYQELMDDMYGLLGDVIPSSRFTRKFQLSTQTGVSRGQLSHAQKVSQWMDTIESDSEADRPAAQLESARKRSSLLPSESDLARMTAPPQRELTTTPQIHRGSPKQSPSRKRSTSDREELLDETSPRSGTSAEQSGLRASPVPSANDNVGAKKHRREPSTAKRVPVTTKKSAQQPRSASLGQSQSTGHLETRTTEASVVADERAKSQPDIISLREPSALLSSAKKRKKNKDLMFLGPEDEIGDGDSSIMHDILPPEAADRAFKQLKSEVAWQKMYHRTGEVPRLVAVQGTTPADGTVPIYRHPADESPPLMPFNEKVDYLRKECEKIVGHQLNHVLIQHYRTGEDNISEHSDKTLDIVRGSSIVNLSLGAMRTMILRTKKASRVDSTKPKMAEEVLSRTTQRIRLPHNSLFILGQRTNANWLHAIRADKRPRVEKSPDELAFDGERISLTFRSIGTFIDLKKQIIWGQGATGKTKEDANGTLKDNEAETVGEELIIGFGKENHLTEREFNWDAVYGKGFDVVNFEVKIGQSSSQSSILDVDL